MSSNRAPAADLPAAEYRVYVCDAVTELEPYLTAWAAIVAGRWVIRYRRRDGAERTVSGPADGPAAELLHASRAAMHDLLAS